MDGYLHMRQDIALVVCNYEVQVRGVNSGCTVFIIQVHDWQFTFLYLCDQELTMEAERTLHTAHLLENMERLKHICGIVNVDRVESAEEKYPTGVIPMLSLKV